jgi:hypothetical protein
MPRGFVARLQISIKFKLWQFWGRHDNAEGREQPVQALQLKHKQGMNPSSTAEV